MSLNSSCLLIHLFILKFYYKDYSRHKLYYTCKQIVSFGLSNSYYCLCIELL